MQKNLSHGKTKKKENVALRYLYTTKIMCKPVATFIYYRARGKVFFYICWRARYIILTISLNSYDS